jgi:hypothetical protein
VAETKDNGRIWVQTTDALIVRTRRLRVHVTTHLHDGLRAKPEQLSYECFTTPLTRRAYTSAVWSEGKLVMALMIWAASPTWKDTLCTRPLSAALCIAKRIESAESSMPATCVRCGTSVRAKRPAPQYASTRSVGEEALDRRAEWWEKGVGNAARWTL